MKGGLSKFFSGAGASDAPEESASDPLALDGKFAEGDGVTVLFDEPPPNGASSTETPTDAEVADEKATAVVLENLRDRVANRLLRADQVTPKQVREAQVEWRRLGEKDAFWRVLARHPEVDRDMVFAEAAKTYAFREAELSDERPAADFVKKIIAQLGKDQEIRLYELRLMPLGFEYDKDRHTNKLVFATHDPTRPESHEILKELSFEQSDTFELRFATKTVLDPYFEALFPPRNEYLDRLEEDDLAFDIGATFDEAKSQLVDEDALDAEINRSSLINLFEASLLEAVRMNASDIHIFPRARHTEIHFRIDGALQHWHTQDKVHPEAMLAVAKDRCLNIDRFEREAAQDGYVQREVDGTIIRYRVSVLPIASSDRSVKAESIVIRVLDDRKVFTSLSAIGLLSGALERFEKAIRQPQGMVIMTGPTGSGKSTTLVAALHSVVRPEVNVLTVEDPVEYLIKDVRQIKLGPRLELEHAIRAILRHDPDIVMVGEMRDRPTAELAIKLANTGHLTFSTLHTNDAPSAVSRLYKMGIEPFLIAYAINLVVAQRLLRKLCPVCKLVEDDPDDLLLRALGFSQEQIDATTFYKPNHDQGCRKCRGVGYKGRRAISEALYFSREIRHLILEAGQSIDEDAIKDQAVEEGMLTLVASAREVVMRGETSIEEVIRVISSDE